jgi:hypothetical protein
MTGGMVSRATVTVKVQVADSRQEFVARQVTTVAPRMNVAPDGGEQLTMAFVGQVAVVVGAGYVTIAVLATPQSQLVRFGGQLMLRGKGQRDRDQQAKQRRESENVSCVHEYKIASAPVCATSVVVYARRWLVKGR